MKNTISRRQQLKSVIALAGAGVVPGALPALGSINDKPKRVLRIAHITDVHVQPELGAGDGFRQCLRHIHAQTDPVDFIINTGDCVMDCMAHDHERTTLIWDLWDKILAAECKLPIKHVIGNHDVWGWTKKASNTTGNEPDWGKGVASKRLKLATPFYSFDQAGWHFIALDTVQPHEDFYLAGIDEGQMAWLRQKLNSLDRKTPVLIFSHIPVMSVAALMKPDIAQKDSFIIPGGKMLLNNVAIKDLLKQNSNVKLCISGHIHLRDQVDYSGVNYLCNGAVCGDYWKGDSHGECDAGYTLIDLFDDGSFTDQYVLYGWKYRV